MLAFSPRSLGVSIGSQDLSLTFARITLPIIIALYFIAKVMNKERVSSSKTPIWKIDAFRILLFLSLAKLAATLINGASILYAVEDLLFSTVVFASFYTLATQRLLHAVMLSVVLAMLTTGLIVLVEMGLQRPLHTAIVDQNLLNERTANGLFRGGAYRVQAIFDNPLSLAEFACYSLPIAMAAGAITRGKARLICWASIGAIATILMLTGSRSGLLVGLIAGLSYFSALNWGKLNRASRGLLIVAMVVVVGYLFALSVQFLITMIAEAQGVRYDLIEDSRRVSSLSRALQFQQVFGALSEKPLYGFGVLQNFSRSIEEIHTLDNYYLRLGLEAGYPGMILFVLFLIASFKHCNRNYSRYPTKIYAMNMSLIATFACYKLFLSMPTNNLYFYALLGLCFGCAAKKKTPHRA